MILLSTVLSCQDEGFSYKPGPTAAPEAFTQLASLSAGDASGSIYTVKSADFNGDGNADLITTNTAGN